MPELISIIVPVYKAEKLLERCVNSITSQTYTNLEILLIDDGSPDNSGKICDELAQKDNRITVIHTKNGGAAKARNIGIDKAKGEYIAFVDSDDYIEPEMYQILLSALKDSGADIACSGIIRESADGKSQSIIRCPGEQKVYSGEDAIKEILLSRHVGSSLWTKLYKRECWSSLRLPEIGRAHV